ncbi:MAG: hypothetical protein IJG84_22300 [Kiritimatiellae bacterium]|nr:hypothetical protein [Kiritimatiellia bacterium]
MKKLVLSSLIASALLPSGAATKEYYFVGASNDWWNAASYSLTQSASGNTTMPGSEDRIVTKKGQILYMDDTTVAFLNTIGGINMYDIGSTLYLNLTTNATVTCAIGDIGGHGYYGNWLIKDGAGVLSFDGENGTLPTSGIYGTAPNKTSYRYCLSFDVRGGGVRMEPKRSDVYRYYIGSVKLAQDTTFYNVNGTGLQVYLVGTLSGAGTFTTENTGNAYDVYISDVSGGGLPAGEFSGTLSGKMNIKIKQSTYLTGTDNSGVSALTGLGYSEENDNIGVIGVRTWAGSFGSRGIHTRDGGWCLRFLNEEDEVVKAAFAIKNSPLAIDAGARGGVWFQPSNWWGWENTDNVQQRLIFTGSNTIANVVNGPIQNRPNYPSFFVTKRGTGIWRFDNENITNSNTSIAGLRGVFAVDEGTLEAVSLAEAGQRCSLGYADQLFEDKSAATNTLATVPYAIRLGSPTTGEGTLSYIGTAAKGITTRPIGVQGKGRLKAPNAPYLNWSGIKGLDSGVENVITFECAADQTNFVSELSGALSVAKDGPGDLVLNGNVAITGDVVVTQGKATLINYNNAPYEWFKVTVKETAAASPLDLYSNLVITTGTDWSANYSRRFEIEEFGLYDSNGNRVNAYQSEWASTTTNINTAGWTVETLQPGQIAPSPTGEVSPLSNGFLSYAWYAADKTVYFPNVASQKYRAASYYWNNGTKYAQYDKPDTWISLVQRLKSEDVGKIASLDICLGGMQRWTPTALEVFGSADGQHWDSLFATNNIEYSTTSRFWLSGSTVANVTYPESTAHTKFALPRTTQSTVCDLPSLRSLSVADGATLKYEGSTPLTVSNLVISVAGAGTLEGAFVFAESGTLEVPDIPEASTVTLSAGSYACCTGFANIEKWSVTRGGIPLRRFVRIVDGNIVISKHGMHIIIW